MYRTTPHPPPFFWPLASTSGPHLPASRRLASSTAPAFPKPASSIARWIPSPLPRPAARLAIPPAVATARGCSVPASLELVFVFDFDVRHYHGQLLLMYIDSRYPIRHRLPPGGSGERADGTLSRVSGYRRSHRGETTHHLFALSRTLRIRQVNGLGFSTDNSISPPYSLITATT